MAFEVSLGAWQRVKFSQSFPSCQGLWDVGFKVASAWIGSCGGGPLICRFFSDFLHSLFVCVDAELAAVRSLHDSISILGLMNLPGGLY